MDSDQLRRQATQEINRLELTREQLVRDLETRKEPSQVWNTDELGREFEVTAFMAPCVFVRRRSDGETGTLFFQNWPRFYWGFATDDDARRCKC